MLFGVQCLLYLGHQSDPHGLARRQLKLFGQRLSYSLLAVFIDIK